MKRGLLILWPFWASTLACFAVLRLTGPTFDGSANQDAMLFRFIATIA